VRNTFTLLTQRNVWPNLKAVGMSYPYNVKFVTLCHINSGNSTDITFKLSKLLLSTFLNMLHTLIWKKKIINFIP
jgi:hypothetical protein